MTDITQTMTIDERTEYDKYTKEQVYEAYVLEVEKTERLTKDINSLQRVVARVRYEVKV